MTALTVQDSDGAQRDVVVRRKAATPNVGDGGVTQEFALMTWLAGRGFVVPEPLMLDTSLTRLPTPYLVMPLVLGTTDVADNAMDSALRQMARFLVRLHAVDIATSDLPPLPARENPVVELPRYLPSRLSGIELPSSFTPSRTGLCHGDFWPGNVIWQDGTLAAVIDWEDAAIGDPLSDLAQCRLELLWRYGELAMTTFTEAYLAGRNINLNALAIWELFVAASGTAHMHLWDLDAQVEAAMRAKAQAFMDKAAAHLDVCDGS